MVLSLEQIFDKGGIYMRIMPFMKRKKGLQFAGIGLDTGGGGGSLPIASAETLGGVKVGEGLSIDDEGTLSTSGNSDYNMFASGVQETHYMYGNKKVYSYFADVNRDQGYNDVSFDIRGIHITEILRLDVIHSKLTSDNIPQTVNDISGTLLLHYTESGTGVEFAQFRIDLAATTQTNYNHFKLMAYCTIS